MIFFLITIHLGLQMEITFFSHLIDGDYLDSVPKDLVMYGHDFDELDL